MTPADLFEWREEADAARAVAAAEAARAEAWARLQRAPHGEVQARRAALKAATDAALRAEVDLGRLRAAHAEPEPAGRP